LRQRQRPILVLGSTRFKHKTQDNSSWIFQLDYIGISKGRVIFRRYKYFYTEGFLGIAFR